MPDEMRKYLQTSWEAKDFLQRDINNYVQQGKGEKNIARGTMNPGY